jgi:hypothetical protein
VAEFQVLYWHDIPLQVRAGNRRNRVSFELAPRFQAAIDQAAMASGLIGTDEYLDGFRWSEIQEREGSAEEVAATVVAELDASYPQIDWQKTAKAIVAKNANQEVE